MVVLACLACGVPARDGIVLVTVDTLRADALGAFGRPDAHTPVLDRVAREGVRASAYAPIPLTTPSHATILTGLHPASHGLRLNGQPLALDHVTLAEILRDAGYATGAVAGAAPVHPAFRLHQGFEWVDFEGLAGDGRPAEEVTRAALAGVARLLEAHPEAPLFLWVHYFDPHSAYAPPPPFDRLFDDGSSSWDGSHETHNQVLYGGLPATPELLARNRNLYQGEVAYADRAIGRLLAGLASQGLADALLVVVGDHGESFRPDYPFDHADRLYHSILHVPLLVRGPGIPAREDPFTGSVPLEDVLPTVLELRGLAAPPAIDGVSRAAELVGAAPARSAPVFAESPRVRPRPDLRQSGLNRGALRAVQLDGCKLVWNLDRAERALHDLRADPEERVNLLERAGPTRCSAERLDRLHAEWARLHPAALTQASPASAPSIPDDLRERLRALGYAIE